MNNGCKGFGYKFRNHLSWQFYKLSKVIKPKDEENFIPSENDFYLVSYPRSGSTWLRVILSEIIFGRSGDSLKDLPNYMPEIGIDKRKDELIRSTSYIVKTHEIYRQRARTASFKKVIYLVRDPRDVAVSYFRYQAAKYDQHDFKKYLDDWVSDRIWPGSWQTHVMSWVGPGSENLDNDIYIIRYEDLLSKPHVTIEKLVEFIGLSDSSEKSIDDAIVNASIQKMREKEEKGVWKGVDIEGMSFIGPGKKELWREKLTEEQAELITKFSKELLLQLNYTID